MKHIIVTTIVFWSFGSHAAISVVEPKYEKARVDLTQGFEIVFREPTSEHLDALFRDLWALNQRLGWRASNDQAEVGEYVVRGAVRTALERVGPLDAARVRQVTKVFLDLAEEFTLVPGSRLHRVATPMNQVESRRLRRIYSYAGAGALALSGGFGLAHLELVSLFTMMPVGLLAMSFVRTFEPAGENVVAPRLRECESLFTNLMIQSGGDLGGLVEQAPN